MVVILVVPMSALAALHYLTDLGAELAQGYYVARPMEGAAAARWARPQPSA